MADPPVMHDFAYVHTDIPAGMTIREWRAQREAARAARRSRRWPRRVIIAIGDAWLHARRPPQHGTGRGVRA